MRIEIEYKALEIMYNTVKEELNNTKEMLHEVTKQALVLQKAQYGWKKLPLWKRILKRY